MRFEVIYGNVDNPYFYYDKPSSLYLDYYMPHGQMNKEMNIEILVPETLDSDNNTIPMAKICKIQLIYVGIYASCMNSNSYNIKYYQK